MSKFEMIQEAILVTQKDFDNLKVQEDALNKQIIENQRKISEIQAQLNEVHVSMFKLQGSYSALMGVKASLEKDDAKSSGNGSPCEAVKESV